MKIVVMQQAASVAVLLKDILPEAQTDICTPDSIDLSADLIILPQEHFAVAEELRCSGFPGEIAFAGNPDVIPPQCVSALPIGYIALPADKSALLALISRCQAVLRHPDRVYALHSRDTVRYIPHDDILYFSSSGHRVQIHTACDEQPLSHLRKLDDIAELLPPNGYIRCHQRYLANLSHVSALNRQDMLLEMDDGTTLSVSKRFYSATAESLLHFTSAE